MADNRERNVRYIAIIGDGDLDVVTSEQNTGLGVVWFENPGAQ